MITTKVDMGRDLTIFTVVGPFQVANVSETLDDFYASGPTKNVLWDFQNAVLPEAEPDEVRRSIRAVHGRAQTRAGGKTALVMPNAVGYSSALAAEEIAESELMPITVQSFIIRSIAEQWLTEDVPAHS